MDFWVYENWRARKRSNVHKGDCSFCNHGEGLEKQSRGEENGKWHGPFSSKEDALKKAISIGMEVNICHFCLK